MKIRVNTETDYSGRDSPSIESFYIEVEAETGDTIVGIASAYLELRKILKAGIKPKEDN